MTEMYLHFRCKHYGLSGNAPVPLGEVVRNAPASTSLAVQSGQQKIGAATNSASFTSGLITHRHSEQGASPSTSVHTKNTACLTIADKPGQGGASACAVIGNLEIMHD